MMIVTAKPMETANVLNVLGENGAWNKPKIIAEDKEEKSNISGSREKRNCTRWYHKGLVLLTGFNTTDWAEGQMLNCSLEGMCVRLNKYIKPHNSLLLRVKSENWDFTGLNNFDGLRTINLGDVKWCNELLNKNSYRFEIGIRYLAPFY
jgi:hypothetical protein